MSLTTVYILSASIFHLAKDHVKESMNCFHATDDLLPSFLDTRPTASDDYIFDYVRRQFPNQKLGKWNRNIDSNE